MFCNDLYVACLFEKDENAWNGEKWWYLTLSSIYSHFNKLKKKSFRKTLWKKVKLLKMSNFNFFHNVFYAICILKSFNAIFQLLFAGSLNLGWSQSGVLWNYGMGWQAIPFFFFFSKYFQKMSIIKYFNYLQSYL